MIRGTIRGRKTTSLPFGKRGRPISEGGKLTNQRDEDGNPITDKVITENIDIFLNFLILYVTVLYKFLF
jgi:hypothetical protein